MRIGRCTKTNPSQAPVIPKPMSSQIPVIPSERSESRDLGTYVPYQGNQTANILRLAAKRARCQPVFSCFPEPYPPRNPVIPSERSESRDLGTYVPYQGNQTANILRLAAKRARCQPVCFPVFRNHIHPEIPSSRVSEANRGILALSLRTIKIVISIVHHGGRFEKEKNARSGQWRENHQAQSPSNHLRPAPSSQLPNFPRIALKLLFSANIYFTNFPSRNLCILSIILRLGKSPLEQFTRVSRQNGNVSLSFLGK